MKKFKSLVSVALAVCMVAALTACGGSSSSEPATTAAAAEAADTDDSAAAEAAPAVAADGEISVFYYTFGDTYISSVRAALDELLDASGLEYNDYDSNNSQTTQTEQVQTALAKGSSCLIVNLVDSGSDDAAQNIIDLASAQNVPVIFFNRSVSEEVVSGYDDCAFIGTDYEQAGHMQGQMIGEYLIGNWDDCDLNGDGEISYVMFKGQEGNEEAIARTEYGLADADEVIEADGKPALVFYDPNNSNLYLVDQTGAWSAAAAQDYMQTILSQYSESNGNMVELVIANNDEMALGAIAALQTAGYNQGDAVVIPVFGVDATDAAKAAIADGSMIGTIKQDAEGMAEVIATVAENFIAGNDKFEEVADIVPAEDIEGTWRVNIPYAVYLGED